MMSFNDQEAFLKFGLYIVGVAVAVAGAGAGETGGCRFRVLRCKGEGEDHPDDRPATWPTMGGQIANIGG